MTEEFDKIIAVINNFGLNPNINEYKWSFVIKKIALWTIIYRLEPHPLIPPTSPTC